MREEKRLNKKIQTTNCAKKLSPGDEIVNLDNGLQ
jgi:hypothetical protein